MKTSSLHSLMAVIVGIMIALALVALSAPAARAERDRAPMSQSRDRVTVRGEVVRLGDLFTNTGDKAKVFVDQAPKPGAEAVYDVHRLHALASAHGLVWRAHSWSERVVVERAARRIGETEILAAVRDSLERENIEGKWDFAVASRGLSLTVAASDAPSLTVTSLHLNRRTGHFTATVGAGRGHGEEAHVTVSGRIERLVEVPTLNRRLATGEVIRRTDIVWTDMRLNQVNRNTLTDVERLIGMTPKRPLRPRQPIRAADIRPPRLVTKGAIVTMTLKTPHMVLTSKGRALEHGALGETIRVRNTQSRTIVEGEVTSQGAVRVTATALPPVVSAARR